MDIDLVYLWVDGNDPVWLTKKNEFLPADRQVDPQVAGQPQQLLRDVEDRLRDLVALPGQSSGAH